jgi:AcrR family transcriptional regulator
MAAAPMNIAEGSDNGACSGDGGTGSTGGDDLGRQRKRGTELETAIRAACVAELAECGYGSLTIESVASRAQTGKASIYRRWPTKQKLVLDSVSDLMIGPLQHVIEVELDDTVTTCDAMLSLLQQAAAAIHGSTGDAMRSIMSESLRDTGFSDVFECDFFGPRKNALLELLRRGVARGEVRPDAVYEFVPDMIAGVLIHRVLLRRLVPDDAELRQLLDGFIMPAIAPH